MQTRSWVLFGVLSSAVAVSATASIGCGAKPHVHTAATPDARFGEYRSFSFGDPAKVPDAYAQSPRAAEVRARLLPLITEALKQKGYVPAEGTKGDLVVEFGSGRRKREATAAHVVHGDALSSNEDDDFMEGTVIIDMFDASNDARVWHGDSREEISESKVNPKLLQRVVHDMLVRFPDARPATATTSGTTR